MRVELYYFIRTHRHTTQNIYIYLCSTNVRNVSIGNLLWKDIKICTQLRVIVKNFKLECKKLLYIFKNNIYLPCSLGQECNWLSRCHDIPPFSRLPPPWSRWNIHAVRLAVVSTLRRNPNPFLDPECTPRSDSCVYVTHYKTWDWDKTYINAFTRTLLHALLLRPSILR